MSNPILSLRACYNFHGLIDSRPTERRNELPRVDFYALYSKDSNGQETHLVDFNPNFIPVDLAKAMSIDWNVAMLQGAVYAMAMSSNGSSVENTLQAMGATEEELSYCAPEDLREIREEIEEYFPDVDPKIFNPS